MGGAFVAGVADCKAGWICFRLYDTGATVVAVINVKELLADRPDGLQALGIHAPLGLLVGTRACEGAACTKLVWPRRTGVFFPACRAALAAYEYEESCQISQGFNAREFSKQSCALAKKIKQLDEAITPAHQAWVFEVHPEVCFGYFAGGKPMHEKNSKAGCDERIEVLTQYLPRIANVVATLPAGVAVDDLLDAAVAALSARRWRQSEAERVCESESDRTGLWVN